MKLSLALPVLVLAIAPCAFAQQRGNGFGGNGNGRNNQQGGTLPLPKGVDRVISIDAYNTLLAQSHDADGNIIYTPIVVKHLYSGGIAALFGGVSIPTAQFVSPGAFGNNGFNGGGGNNRGGGNGGFGGNNGGGIGGGFGGNNGGIGGGIGGIGGGNGIGTTGGFGGFGSSTTSIGTLEIAPPTAQNGHTNGSAKTNRFPVPPANGSSTAR